MQRVVLVLVIVVVAARPLLGVVPEAGLIVALVGDRVVGKFQVLEVVVVRADVSDVPDAEGQPNLEHAVLLRREERSEVETLPDPAVLPVVLPVEVEALVPYYLPDPLELVRGVEVVDLEELEHVVPVNPQGLDDHAGEVHRLDRQHEALIGRQDVALRQEAHEGLLPVEGHRRGGRLGEVAALSVLQAFLDPHRGRGGPGLGVERDDRSGHRIAEIGDALDGDEAAEILGLANRPREGQLDAFGAGSLV